MGYDYYWSGSSTAGPVSPLAGESYNVTKSVDTYLSAGVPAQKLMLGIPWFGYNWPVNSSIRKAATIGKATSLTTAAAETLTQNYGKTFDQSTKVPWISYKDANNLYRQVWFDDATSYFLKYDLVNNRNLAGIGIWALSYENGKKEIWQGIQSAFSATAIGDDLLFTRSNAELSVFPNPVRNVASVLFNLSEQQRVDLKVVDLTGRIVQSLLNKELPANNYTIYMDCTLMKSGLYLLVLTTPDRNLTYKFVVEKN
jgi:GH18 family chitinase